MFGSHLAIMSSLVTERCPCSAAQCSGLEPVLSVVLALQVFDCVRRVTVDEWPFHEAQCNGVQPYCRKREGKMK